MANLVASLLLAFHFLTFGSQLLALVLFWQTNNTNSFAVCFLTLICTGSFFSDAVWNGVRWRPCGAPVLPIAELPPWPKVLCCSPLVLVCGCLQGVMVPLTLQQVQTGDGHLTGQDSHSGPVTTGFHGKAVNGLFEGIVCSAVLLYGYLGIAFPEGSSHPVTTDFPDPNYLLNTIGMRQILRFVGFVSFASGGLGILHMDHCLCFKLPAYIHSGSHPRCRLFRHWLFRTTELISRVALHICFVLVTVEYLPHLRFFPLLMSILFSVTMMYLYGGSEVSRGVIWLCGFLCTFIDIFRFVDSPYKRGAARRLSKIVLARHYFELVYMPLLAVCLIGWAKPGPHAGLQEGLQEGARQLMQYLKYLFLSHRVVVIAIAANYPVYFWLLYSIGVQRFLEKEDDIFKACRKLRVEEVRKLTLGGLRPDFNSQDNEGRTPLVVALQEGRADDARCAEICRMLVRSGARVDLRVPAENIWIRRIFRREARYQWTALHIAAARGSAEVLRALLLGADGNAAQGELQQSYQDVVGNTPLHVAVIFGKVDAIRILVARFEAWRAVRNHKGSTPLDLAPSSGDVNTALGQPALIDGANVPDPVEPAAWAVQEFHVERTRGLYRAPGLCSFVVGSVGGPAAGGVLRLGDIPEDGPPVVDGREDQTPQAAAPNVAVQDLEPIDKEARVPIQEWEERRQGFVGADVGMLIRRIAPRDMRRRPPSAGFCPQAVLGKGAYGVVWLARRRGEPDGEPYAVKNVEGMTRVARREFDMSDRVRVSPHPCLVKLFGVQELEDARISVIIMEFLPGGDLLDAIKTARTESQLNQLPYGAPAEAVPWLGQIFLALEHLHKQTSVLLRDLKPENVVLGAHRRAKLIDLGLGRIGTQTDGGFTLQAAPPGTPGYCAPEVLMQEPYDEKADMFSFGVTAWMLLTGGLVNIAAPPTGYGRRPDFRDCFNDCYLLQECIEAPQANGARPIGSADASAFVMSLISRLPSARLDHVGVRQHPFFAAHLQQPLPDRSLGRNGVEHWLEHLGF